MQTVTSSLRGSSGATERRFDFVAPASSRLLQLSQLRQSHDVKAVSCVAAKMEGVCYFTVTVTS